MESAKSDWLDRASITASFLCLIHCLALPLILSALPALSRILAIPESFHIWVLAFAVPASGIALVSGRARHGASRTLILGAAGLALLAIGALLYGGTGWETPTTVAGSLVLTAAHVINWRLRQRCGCDTASA
ncbi:MerC domain-containing protein [Stakelama marina]|uniref:MerC domain-containing protein n=1 Tax=Stakelama marina TaxID=2826939 RepID=A0A8T4ID91_9SPHN|nr:MerC domain-containing protein [Stakelama marina]MBR0552617.1 MerC domain-containing protein [Stakelama marina]